MPMVQITILQGRSAEQKRKVAKRVTEVLAEELGTKPEGVAVAFYEVTKESYALGGVLMADRQ